MKEANLKKLYTIWFQVYNILEKEKLWSKTKNQVLSGTGGREELIGVTDSLEQWNYSVWCYHGGYVSLYICQVA